MRKLWTRFRFYRIIRARYSRGEEFQAAIREENAALAWVREGRLS